MVRKLCKVLHRIRRKFRKCNFSSIPLLPELSGVMPSDKQIHESFVAIQGTIAFKMFCASINDRIRREDAILCYELDREKLADSALRRQSLIQLVESFWQTINYTEASAED